jgi:ribonuclease P protein subunit POP4
LLKKQSRLLNQMKKTIYPNELVGEEIEIIEAKNTYNLSIKGKVVDETKTTLKVEQNGKFKTLLKNNITIKLIKSGKIISGQEIAKRPEERLKGR